jgi:CRISPR/Cas system CSM-associated protein Csm3 (group 7 of RAMP superfamily)
MRTTLITARLTMTAPGGVAGPERSRAVEPSAEDRGSDTRNDLPLRLDPDGNLHLPGTSVAGNLRAHCTDHGFPAELFGLVDTNDGPRASAIQVLGVRLHANTTEPLWTTRVAIDRHRGAPQVNTLFSAEQLPAGTTFDIYLRWDNPSDELTRFRALLRTWRPRLGRGITTGAGACTVTALGQRDYDLSTADGLAAWLAETALDDYPRPDTPVDPPDRTEDVVDVELTIVDGLHIGSGALTPEPGREGKVARILRDPAGRPRIPGSSLKGVLRSRAEYICRVLKLASCPDGAAATCGVCLPCAIFGWSPRGGDDRMGARGAVVVHDAVIEGEPAELRPHVALDRVTGGQRSGLLYTDEVVVAGRFRLRVEPLRTPTPAESALLNAVIADLHEGLVGIGSATTRGLGTVRVTSGNWQLPELSTLAETLGAVHV